MSIAEWLLGSSPKPSSKRKIPELESDSDLSVSASPIKSRKFTKKLNQKDFEWYIQVDGKYFCKLCRDAKQNSAYAIGHDKASKTTNHRRHAASKCFLLLFSLSFPLPPFLYKFKKKKNLQTLKIHLKTS